MITPEEDLDAWLAQTLVDHRFSRGERQELMEALGSGMDRVEVREKAFEVARSALSQVEDGSILDWLEEVVRATRDAAETKPVTTQRAEAHFSPGDDCLHAIARFIAHARHSLDICVFTITDDRVSEAILDAHHRKVVIRIITDNAKAEDLGSDIGRFERAGIEVKIDQSPYHMHHKFAIADEKTLLTGSYNWTRGAAHDNQENLIVTDDPRLVGPFGKAFDRLWVIL